MTTIIKREHRWILDNNRDIQKYTTRGWNPPIAIDNSHHTVK